MKKLLIVLCCFLALQSCNNDDTKDETINGFDINWTGDLNKDEKDAIREMINNMIKVDGGTFYMGAQKDSVEYLNYNEYATSWESPVHEVTVSTFFINKYEVTQKIWEIIMHVIWRFYVPRLQKSLLCWPVRPLHQKRWKISI